MQVKNFFSFYFWKKIWLRLGKKDRLFFVSSLSLAAVCLIIIIFGWYFSATELVAKPGGILRQGYIGQPTSLNPILAQTECDQELTNLVFNGILKADGQGGTENDLAEEVIADKEGRIWQVKLREDVFWHDGERFDANDIIFTVSAIQNTETRSPRYLSWQGVSVSKKDDFNVVFELREPYAFFEENLKQKIAPEHIFKDVPVANLYLSGYNLEPVGTGPYVFSQFEKTKSGFIASYLFKKNKDYFLSRPFLDQINFKFYKSEPEAVKAFNNRQVDFLPGISTKGLENVSRRFLKNYFILPHYFALFFNENINNVFADKNVRRALNLSIDKEELVKTVFDGRAEIAYGPLNIFSPKNDLEEDFSLLKAEEILASFGWEDRDGDGVREKKLSAGDSQETPLSFEIVVPEQDNLVETASYLKKQFAKIGARAEIKMVSQDDLQKNYFRSRVYDCLIFGNIANFQPDLFPFWHSSQRFYPGLNLALYKNDETDSLLEKIRQEFDSEKRASQLSKLEEKILKDTPAIFLFNPYYNLAYFSGLHMGDLPFKLNSSAEKYFNVQDWYLKTKRVFK